MMRFTENPEHGRLIDVTFDDNRPNLIAQMTIAVRYCIHPEPCDQLRKAIRLDHEVMHLLKAAPEMLQASESCLNLIPELIKTQSPWLELANAVAEAKRTTY